MFQGFYNLTSGVLTQTRRMNVISNNMSNVSTPGYKRDQFVCKTFKEEMIYRSGNKDKSSPAQLGTMNRIVTADRNYTDFAAGGYESTESPLDFAIATSGFFRIQSGNGTVYTRNGSFSLDNNGYLTLQGVGRVLGQNGPIYLGTDKIRADRLGNLYSEDGNNFLGRLSIVDFQNYDEELTKTTGDVYTSAGQGTAVNADVVHKALESSNVEPVNEMTQMMAGERALQSSAQVLKMYDQIIGKVVTQLGPI